MYFVILRLCYNRGMTTPESIQRLVEKFEAGRAHFTQPDYNEAQLRQEFVNPFFAALGWDVGDSHQVLHEAGLKSGGSTKHPDYSFLAGRRRAFYVETKKPAIDISQQIEPAGQLRSYGWSGNTAVGILTNFAEFAVYDCRIPPEQGDPAAEARVWHLTSAQYPAAWTRLQETLSPLAVRQGKHKDLLAELGKGVLPVDAAFLRDMENWRSTLAEQLYKQARFIDRELSQRELNQLVQRTIDRIVFLRIAEDRNLEPYGTLERVAREKQVYEKIKNLYRAADKKYNSGLFYFELSDELSPPPPTNCPWTSTSPTMSWAKSSSRCIHRRAVTNFSVIAADILGQVYERFLGKVIEVRSADHETRVIVEEKPEVRKAGGVYYTPEYIVDYIVENTLGKLLEGATPEQAARLRVLDPACGSGSFLTGAYNYLLDWHIDYYRRHPAQFRNRRRDTAEGILLTTAEKRRILLNNIYGVDLDQSAVEVTKLSLLLKMLENENDSTGLRDMDGPILPDLGGNIKWGNSLVGSDFYDGADVSGLADEELQRVKAFDWGGTGGFADIMAAGGFDAVIGNPPYIPIESMTDELRTYYQAKFPQLERKYDSSVIFILAGLQKLNSKGLLGFISSVTWQTGTNYSKLRQYIVNSAGICKLVNLPFNVFKDAYVDTGVYVLSRRQRMDYLIYQFDKKAKVTSLADLPYQSVSMSLMRAPDFKVVLEPAAVALLANIEKRIRYSRLGELTISTQGLSGSRFKRVSDDSAPHVYPFLEKGQVYRYDFQIAETSRVTLEDKPSLRVFYGEQPKILMRRLVNRQDRLMAGYTATSMVFKKDLNPFILTNGTGIQSTYWAFSIAN